MAEKQGKVTRRGFGTALAATTAAAAAAPPAAAQIATPALASLGRSWWATSDRSIRLSSAASVSADAEWRTFGSCWAMTRVRFVGIADVREDAREMVKSTVDDYYKNNDCKMYRDASEILARPDVDALLIATSDRWHGLMAMWAAQSGKDMYIEKPGAMSINESYTMAENVSGTAWFTSRARRERTSTRSSSPWGSPGAASWAG